MHFRPVFCLHLQFCDTFTSFFTIREYYISDQQEVKDLLPNRNIMCLKNDVLQDILQLFQVC